MVRDVVYPPGSWPREMRAKLAPGYCSEPSGRVFLAKVPEVYFEPTRAPGVQSKWHILKLDQAIDRRHGLRSDGPLVEDLEALI
jgi:hypothetical protein